MSNEINAYDEHLRDAPVDALDGQRMDAEIDAEYEASYDTYGTAQIDADDRRTFVLAGKAVFTVANPDTGCNFTYRVKRKDTDDGRTLHFVQILTGPNNLDDYSFIGTIFDGGNFVHGRKSRIGKDAPSVKAFQWMWARLSASRDLSPATFWHQGKCGRCGRALTVPSSIASGLGPVCAGKE